MGFPMLGFRKSRCSCGKCGFNVSLLNLNHNIVTSVL